MARTLTFEWVCELIRAQANAADMWIREYEAHKDLSSLRNAALAIGKVGGQYNVLISTAEDIPEDIIAITIRMNNIWVNLELEK